MWYPLRWDDSEYRTNESGWKLSIKNSFFRENERAFEYRESCVERMIDDIKQTFLIRSVQYISAFTSIDCFIVCVCFFQISLYRHESYETYRQLRCDVRHRYNQFFVFYSKRRVNRTTIRSDFFTHIFIEWKKILPWIRHPIEVCVSLC